MGICKFNRANGAYHENTEPEGEAYDLGFDVKQGNVVVFVEPGCKKSEKTLEVLRSVNVRPVIQDISQSSRPKALKKALKEASGSSSFPVVFVVGKHYGSLSEVEKGVNNHTIQKLINSNLERMGGRLAS
jgi:glutaredoxin